MRHASPSSPDLGDFLDREVFPALWLRLDQAFPEFGFVRRSTYWLATREEDPAHSLARQGRIVCGSMKTLPSV